MLSNYGKWSSLPRSGHSRVGFKSPLTAIGLDYGDHGAAHVPSPLGALESSHLGISRTCLVCVMYGRVRFFARWERVTAAVAAPRRFLLSVCVSYGSSISAVPSASQKCSHGEESNREKDSAGVITHFHSLPSRARSQARFAVPRPYAEHVRAACATSAEVSFSARDTIQRLRDGRHQTLGAECGGVTPVPTCRRHQSCLCCIMLHSVGLRSLLRTACCSL